MTKKADSVARKHKSKSTNIKPKQVNANNRRELEEIIEGADGSLSGI